MSSVHTTAPEEPRRTGVSIGTVYYRYRALVRIFYEAQKYTKLHNAKQQMQGSTRPTRERVVDRPDVPGPDLIRTKGYTIERIRPQSPYLGGEAPVILMSSLRLITVAAHLTSLLIYATFSNEGWPFAYMTMVYALAGSKHILIMLNIIVPLLVGEKGRRAQYHLLGSRTPTVDICITCCGEPLDIILNTVRAAVAQDFPAQNFRVCVLDDGNSARLRMAVLGLSKEVAQKAGPQVLYRSRRSTANMLRHFKSGNLRYGINELNKLGPLDYFANLDCDMIPDPHWLRTILPHIIMDNTLGLINPPQNYYNVPQADPLGQQTALDVFFQVLEPMNDRFDAARCMGTGFIARHSALLDIGGWPLINVGEDFMLSSRLSAAGWKTMFLNENVQCGLAPDCLHAHIKQKQRWVDGAIEVHKRFDFYRPWSLHTGLKKRQSFIFLLQAMQEYWPLVDLLTLISLPFALCTLPLSFRDDTNASRSRVTQRHLFLAAYASSKLLDQILYKNIGARRLEYLRASEVWMAPYTAARCIRSFFPCLFKRLTFHPSGSITSYVQERTPSLRKTWKDRLVNRFMIAHLAYFIYVTVSCLILLTNVLDGNKDSGTSLAFISPGPIIMLFGFARKALVPLLYMANPPTVPDWKQLTFEDKDGVRRPKRTTSNDLAHPHKASTLSLSCTQATEILIIAVCYYFAYRQL